VRIVPFFFLYFCTLWAKEEKIVIEGSVDITSDWEIFQKQLKIMNDKLLDVESKMYEVQEKFMVENKSLGNLSLWLDTQDFQKYTLHSVVLLLNGYPVYRSSFELKSQGRRYLKIFQGVLPLGSYEVRLESQISAHERAPLWSFGLGVKGFFLQKDMVLKEDFSQYVFVFSQEKWDILLKKEPLEH
jgi:hypothetical protein